MINRIHYAGRIGKIEIHLSYPASVVDPVYHVWMLWNMIMQIAENEKICYSEPHMAFIPPVMFTHLAQITVVPTSVISSLTASVVKDFFMNVFLHPGQNMLPVIIFCAAIAAPLVGVAFLAKKVYEKYSQTT